MAKRYCWKCEQHITGREIPRYGSDDYLCEPCHDGEVDAYLDYINT